jgi:hypothetical protein
MVSLVRPSQMPTHACMHDDVFEYDVQSDKDVVGRFLDCHLVRSGKMLFRPVSLCFGARLGDVSSSRMAGAVPGRSREIARRKSGEDAGVDPLACGPWATTCFEPPEKEW